MVREYAKLWAMIAMALMLVSGAIHAQTPADAVADAVANSGVFPLGTTVVSVTVDGSSAVVELSEEAAPFGLGDAQVDDMCEAVANALGEFPEITAIEVIVAGKPLWQYLPPSSAPDDGGVAPQSIGTMSVGPSIKSWGILGYDEVGNDPLPPGDPRILTNELAGKLVALHPSHGSYWHQGYGYWFRAMRTMCGPNPEPPRPPGWTGSVYQPSNYYYWTKGFQWGSFYEDDMSPETIRFLKAYLDSSGAEVWVSRNLDKNAGDFPVPFNGKYPNCSFPLPRWQTAAKYYLEERGDVPQWVWDEPALTAQTDKDIRARPYYANYRMEQAGLPWQNCVSFSLHTNAAGEGYARGTEIYWYTSKYPYLETEAKRFVGAVQSAVIDAIRNKYDGHWADPMYPYTGVNPPEWPTARGTYVGYTHSAVPARQWANRGVKTSNFGEIREAKMPAGLMELVFHDDWKWYPDHVFMMDQIFRAHVAWGMYEGICNYFYATPKPRLAATVQSVSFPSLVGPNAAINGSVTVRNEGMAWCWGNKWVDMLYFPYTVWKLAATGNDQFAPGTKIAIPEDAVIMPADTVTFNIGLTSPATTGLYTTEWRMLKDDAYGGAFGQVATAQIQVDADPPVIDIKIPEGATYLHAGSLTIAFTAIDEFSGVASLVGTLDGNPINSGDTISLLWSTLGTHTLTVTAVDGLGNAGTKSVSFEIIATIESLIAAVNELYATGHIDNEGIQTSLLAKLAKYEKDTGDIINAKNYLKEFKNEVSAQSGKHISVAAADLLLADAQYVIDHLPAK